MESIKKSAHFATQIQGILQSEPALTSVSAKSVNLPIGRWAGRAGKLYQDDVVGFMMSQSPALSKVLGMSEARYENFVKVCTEELDDGNVEHVCWRVYGRKVGWEE